MTRSAAGTEPGDTTTTTPAAARPAAQPPRQPAAARHSRHSAAAGGAGAARSPDHLARPAARPPAPLRPRPSYGGSDTTALRTVGPSPLSHARRPDVLGAAGPTTATATGGRCLPTDDGEGAVPPAPPAPPDGQAAADAERRSRVVASASCALRPRGPARAKERLLRAHPTDCSLPHPRGVRITGELMITFGARVLFRGVRGLGRRRHPERQAGTRSPARSSTVGRRDRPDGGPDRPGRSSGLGSGPAEDRRHRQAYIPRLDLEWLVVEGCGSRTSVRPGPLP